MAGHSDGWEEIRGAPLHIDALKSICIIAHPELIKVRQYTPVGTSTTRCTSLDSQIRIFGTNTLTGFLKTTMVLDIKVALIVHSKILRTVIQDRHIGIPLDIIYLRILGHEVINNREHKVLHLGITHVENELRTSTTLNSIALRSFDNPIGVSIIKFRNRVGHFWLNPNTKLYTVFLGIAKKSFNTLW